MLKEHGRTLRWLKSAFMEIKYTMGIRLENTIRRYLEHYLRDIGLLPEEKKLTSKFFEHEGERIEINIFCDEPLVLGEVTTFLHGLDEFNAIIEKFEIVERIIGKTAKLKIVFIGGVNEEIYEKVVEVANKHDVKIIVGEIVELWKPHFMS